jgi:hypothetical protein
MRGVIEAHVPVLGREGEFLRRFLVLRQESERCRQSSGEQTRDEKTHAQHYNIFQL